MPNLPEPTKRVAGAVTSFWHEFKEFAIKGNAVDLAVGVVIGAAFGTVVKSLVDDVIMPPLGLLTGGVDFKNKEWILKPGVFGPDGTTYTTKPVALSYGVFLNNVISFLIVAFSIFFVVKLISMLHRAPSPDAPPPLTPDQELLTEIRDLLKEDRTQRL